MIGPFSEPFLRRPGLGSGTGLFHKIFLDNLYEGVFKKKNVKKSYAAVAASLLIARCKTAVSGRSSG